MFRRAQPASDRRRPARCRRPAIRLPACAAALLGLVLAGSAGASTEPPKLHFTPAEIAFAEQVARVPGLAAFYGGNGLNPVFTGPEARARRAALLAAVETAPEHGLPPARYRPERLRVLVATDDTDPALELELARLFALWVQDVSAGLIDPRKADRAIKRAPEGADIAALLADFAGATDPAAVLARAAPADPRYAVLKAALARARGTAVPEGTPPAPEGLWRPGNQGPDIAALRARLAAAGFPAAGEATLYDDALAAAVAGFQEAAGLPVDGIAGPQTIARLNAPPGRGPRDLLVAMERLRWLPDDLAEGEDRYIWVNLPEFSAAIIEGGARVFETKVVIGKTDPDMQTPEFSERMRHVVANPRWNVPRSIAVKEYLPRLKQNPNAAGHLKIVDRAGRVVPRSAIDFSRYSASSFPYRLVQAPSDDNALGAVKFLFPNPWNIYLHDTPSKGLFANAVRAYSHGCVRVARPLDLAHALLSRQVEDPAATFAAALRAGGERYLTLKPTVPIHLVYFTTLPDEGGTIRHYRDIYGRDARVWAALEAALDARPDEMVASAE